MAIELSPSYEKHTTKVIGAIVLILVAYILMLKERNYNFYALIP